MKALEYTIPTDIMANKIFDASRMGILFGFTPSYPELFTKFMHFTIEKKRFQDGYLLECNYYDEISFLAVKKVPINRIDRDKDILDFIIDSIDLGYYLLVPVDTQYIIHYRNYGRRSSIHHLFLYGYDRESEQVLCGDFYHYSDGKFSVKEVAFSEIADAYNSVLDYLRKTPDPMDYSDEWMRDIELLRLMKNQKVLFSLDNLIVNLDYFLDSRDSGGNKGIKENLYYGMETYELIFKYLDDLRNFKDSSVDTRILTLLYYRYIFMELQCRYVETELKLLTGELSAFYDGFRRLRNIAKKMVFLTMKYNLTFKEETKTGIIVMLRKCQIDDQRLMTDYRIRMCEIRDLENRKTRL